MIANRTAARLVAMTAIMVLTIGSATDRSTPRVMACGPFIDFTVFTPAGAPETPSFLQGRLGIIQPSYARRYLVAAWRTLKGKPLTAVEQRAYQGASIAAPPRDAVRQWLDARGAVPGVHGLPEMPQPYAMLTGQDTFAYIRNCGDSAFETAASTLQDRRARLGDASPLLTDWVNAQDLVFANCSRRAGPSVPTMLSADAPALAQADRAYQIAAAHFYAGQFVEAEAAFTAIARDSASPWRTTAPYLAARAIVRQATIGGPNAQGDPAAFARALGALNTILHDGTRQETYPAVRRLRQFVVSRTQPRDVLLEAAADLVSPAHADRFGERLADYEYLSNRLGGSSGWLDEASANNDAADLLNWVATLRDRTEAPLAHALGRWHQSRGMPWLVATMMLLPPGHPRQAELLSVASAVGPDSPAYPTLAFHTARLLLRGARPTEARAVLDRAIGMAGMPAASVNLFKAARLQTARTADEYLADAARVAVGYSDPDGNLAPLQRVSSANEVLDRDVIDVLNERVPIAVLRRIASNADLPSAARDPLTLATFTRALLVDQWQTARAMLPDVARAAPSLATSLEPLATSDDARMRDEAALLLLHTPGLRPYLPAWGFRKDVADRHTGDGLKAVNSLRDNWWCAFRTPDATEVAAYYTPLLQRGNQRVSPVQADLHADPTVLPTPAFLTAADRQAAAEEWRALEIIDTGPNELGRRVLAWAERNPTDPRVPEALHRIVRASRVGCTNEATGAISRAAFQRLHARYPRSPWTARTPHWFK